jgi:rhomboid protease GluP
MSSSQKFKITAILIGLNLAVYIYTSLVGGNFFTTSNEMVLQYGQVNGLVMYYGAYYQLLTSMFVHAGIIHLAGNMLFLLVFGLRGEEMFSLLEYIGIYILGGLAGNVLSLVMGPDLISVGASGAIFAMFGACAIYARRSIGQSIVGALIFGFFLLMISAGENVNYLAHIGGLVAGLAIGYIIARRRKPQMSYQASHNYMIPF